MCCALKLFTISQELWMKVILPKYILVHAPYIKILFMNIILRNVSEDKSSTPRLISVIRLHSSTHANRHDCKTVLIQHVTTSFCSETNVYCFVLIKRLFLIQIIEGSFRNSGAKVENKAVMY